MSHQIGARIREVLAILAAAERALACCEVRHRLSRTPRYPHETHKYLTRAARLALVTREGPRPLWQITDKGRALLAAPKSEPFTRPRIASVWDLARW